MNTLWLKQTQRVSSCYLLVTVHVHKKTSSCAENICIITVTQNATWLLFKVPSSKAKLSLCITTHTHTHIHKPTQAHRQSCSLTSPSNSTYLSPNSRTKLTRPSQSIPTPPRVMTITYQNSSVHHFYAKINK
jgi:hypothetical protein